MGPYEALFIIDSSLNGGQPAYAGRSINDSPGCTRLGNVADNSYISYM